MAALSLATIVKAISLIKYAGEALKTIKEAGENAKPFLDALFDKDVTEQDISDLDARLNEALAKINAPLPPREPEDEPG